MRQRAKRAITIALILVGIGAIYAIIIHFTGRGIPCVFNIITGWKCPGCGVTKMCMSLLRLAFKTAFEANAGLLCLLPAGGFLAGRYLYIYIKRGVKRDRLTDIVIYVLIGILLVWGVVRNII